MAHASFVLTAIMSNVSDGSKNIALTAYSDGLQRVRQGMHIDIVTPQETKPPLSVTKNETTTIQKPLGGNRP
jgi:hypothetical protein